jgi:hypothetical protein
MPIALAMAVAPSQRGCSSVFAGWRHGRSIAYNRQAFSMALCLSGASTTPSYTPFLIL